MHAPELVERMESLLRTLHHAADCAMCGALIMSEGYLSPRNEHYCSDACRQQGETRRARRLRNTGENSPYAKLTEQSVAAIRERYATGRTTIAALSRDYGVSVTTIRGVVLRWTWKHVA